MHVTLYQHISISIYIITFNKLSNQSWQRLTLQSYKLLPVSKTIKWHTSQSMKQDVKRQLWFQPVMLKANNFLLTFIALVGQLLLSQLHFLICVFWLLLVSCITYLLLECSFTFRASVFHISSHVRAIKDIYGAHFQCINRILISIDSAQFTGLRNNTFSKLVPFVLLSSTLLN